MPKAYRAQDSNGYWDVLIAYGAHGVEYVTSTPSEQHAESVCHAINQALQAAYELGCAAVEPVS